MKNFSTKYPVDGTSALKFNSLDDSRRNAAIVSFPQTSKRRSARNGVTYRTAPQKEAHMSPVRRDRQLSQVGNCNSACNNHANRSNGSTGKVNRNNGSSSISGIPFNRMTRLQVAVSSIVLGAITYVGFFMPF